MITTIKPSFIKQVGHHGLKALRAHLSVFSQLVHVHSVLDFVQNCLKLRFRKDGRRAEYLNVCSKSRKTNEDSVCNFEDFGKVSRDCVKLLAVAVVGSDADAVVA